MRKSIIAFMALLFVAALAPALGAPLFNGATPVYAHPGHIACTWGAAAVFGLGAVDGPVDAGLGRIFGKLTADLATLGPNALSDDVAFLHSFVLCDTGP